MIDLCGIDVLIVYKQKKKRGGGRNGHGMKSFIATVLNTVAHYILLDAAHYTQGIKNYQNLGFHLHPVLRMSCIFDLFWTRFRRNKLLIIYNPWFHRVLHSGTFLHAEVIRCTCNKRRLCHFEQNYFANFEEKKARVYINNSPKKGLYGANWFLHKK